MEINNNLNIIDCCEVCQNSNLAAVLDLGYHPLCDDLVSLDSVRVCKEYPLQILFCDICQTAHQKFQIPKTELFPKSYHYRARFTMDVLSGMNELVESLITNNVSLKDKKVLDIGCNDGSLLDIFSLNGAITFGIEPTDAFQDAVIKGHKGFNDFFSAESAEKFVNIFGKADIVTFTNVFAHIENLNEVITALKIVMNDDSLLIIENHYLGAVFEKNQFDTFYHEHPRTYSATSFKFIAKKLDRDLLHIEYPNRYGGNIRVTIGKRNLHGIDLDNSIHFQNELNFISQFNKLQYFIESWSKITRAEIEKNVKKYGKIKGKALPGRASILIKLLGLTENEIEGIYEKPGSKKIGNYVPGTRIPILSDEELIINIKNEYVLINFAWHIHTEIENYLKKLGFEGTLIKIL